MVKKIISGGQTGVDRAALDFALKFDVPHGGWIVKGRWAEDGVLPDKYMLQEIPEPSYPRRTLKNVLESDGTLLVSRGPLTGGSDYTRKMAVSRGRPHLHIDLDQTTPFQAAEKIRDWIASERIEVLNVAGPRGSKDPKIYNAVLDMLETAYFLEMIDSSLSRGPGKPYESLVSDRFPQTPDDAAEEFISGLSFAERTKIANMSPAKFELFGESVARDIIARFGLARVDSPLLKSCRQTGGFEGDDVFAAVSVILERAGARLRQKRNVLKLVKSQ